jgi:hypothetical protein
MAEPAADERPEVLTAKTQAVGNGMAVNLWHVTEGKVASLAADD